MDKSDSRLSIYQTLMLDLIKNERNRPLDEQFPFLHTDMDEIRENLHTLESASLRLVANQKNVADEMEYSLGVLLIKWLECNGYEDVAPVPILNGEIFLNKSQSLVQWDNIIGATHSGNEYLFLMECKDIGHENDIIFRPADRKTKKLDLSEKINRTYDYMNNVLPGVDTVSVWRGMRSQILELKNYANAKLVFVYSCGSRISDSIRSRIADLQSNFVAEKGDSINVWTMSSLRCSEVVMEKNEESA